MKDARIYLVLSEKKVKKYELNMLFKPTDCLIVKETQTDINPEKFPNMLQEWKIIPGFTDYEVSNDGKIRSKDRQKVYRSGRKMSLSGKEKLLRKHPANGFLMTDLIDDRGRRRTVYPHKMVATVFVQNDKPRKKKVVMHIDGDTNNNSYVNLRWATVSESIQRGFDLGLRDNSNLWEKRRAKYGPKGGNRSMGRPDPLTEADKMKIRELRESKNFTLAALADKFKCSISHIHKTVRMEMA